MYMTMYRNSLRSMLQCTVCVCTTITTPDKFLCGVRISYSLTRRASRSLTAAQNHSQFQVATCVFVTQESFLDRSLIQARFIFITFGSLHTKDEVQGAVTLAPILQLRASFMASPQTKVHRKLSLIHRMSTGCEYDLHKYQPMNAH